MIINFYDEYLVCAWRPIDLQNEKSDFGTVEFLWKDKFGRKCVNKPDARQYDPGAQIMTFFRLLSRSGLRIVTILAINCFRSI